MKTEFTTMHNQLVLRVETLEKVRKGGVVMIKISCIYVARCNVRVIKNFEVNFPASQLRNPRGYEMRLDLRSTLLFF